MSQSRRRRTLHLIILTAALAPLLMEGCAAPSKGPPPAPRDDLEIIEVASGDQLTWSGLLEATADADVVILGEQHDDAVAHATQLAFLEDVLERWPDSALAMEMIERDEQLLVDDYLDGLITTAEFAKLAQSSSWTNWDIWYQPIVDAARDAQSRVIAANAPRRYVKIGRRDGYAAIDALPPERRTLVDHPEQMSGGAYRERFFSLAGGHGEVEADDEMVTSFYRSQQIWDATMAASIVRANPRRDAKVVLLVGQFHADFDGGIVQELRRRDPSLNVKVVSLQRSWPDEEDDLYDVPRADVVVVTEPDEAR
jgi:uncharacterized iron-regulated protein